MADTTTIHTAPANPLSTFIAPFLRALDAVADAHARTREFERLSALSDDALARRGLARHDLARHVYRDILA